MTDPFYSTPEWNELREYILARDGRRCTVGRLLGGACSGSLHVHHIEPRSERPDLELDEDNCATVCASHHATWEALRRAVMIASGRELPPCGHHHPYREGREECDRRRRARILERRLASSGQRDTLHA